MFSDAGAFSYGVLFLVTPLSLTLGYHAMSRFPPSVHVTRAWSVLTTSLYALTFASLLMYGIPSALLYWMHAGVAAATVIEWAWLFAIGRPLQDMTLMLAAAGTSAVLVRNVRQVREFEVRKRVRWALYGYAAATPPLFAYLAMLFVLDALDKDELWD